ncbi:MAG: plastocyanin/azurin family copper-binding protein [Halobacteriales archaeon]|nr:plastocyanin/azurin family copper-binding protein [Halobacteriales archaeon]
MRRRRFLAAAAAGTMGGLAGCGLGGGATPSGDYDVGMGASVFKPRDLTVSVGDTVRWKNTNSRAHTVTAYGTQRPEGADYWATGDYETEEAARDGFYGSFGGAISSDQVFEHTFEVPGDHHYFCIPHERAGMVGVVVVEG